MKYGRSTAEPASHGMKESAQIAALMLASNATLTDAYSP